MKTNITRLFFVVASLFLFSFVNKTIGVQIGINEPLPLSEEKVKDVNGAEITMNSVKTSKGILVVFSCNKCPYVKLGEARMKAVFEECKKQGIGCIIINSNESERSEGDSYPEMVKYATSQNYCHPYVLDMNSKLADAFGATKTPEFFLFSSTGLIYKGGIDDNLKEVQLVKENYLKDAIQALINNEKPKIQETKAFGCTIKRVE